MSTHEVSLAWKRDTPDFTYESYRRDHTWTFGSGSTIDASAAPEFRGNPSLPNPEDALVAAIASCHMLSFLAIASRAGWTVDSYEDHAVGVLEKNDKGRLAITRATLKPRITFSGRTPDAAELERMHHQAHDACFIANSVKTEITIEPENR